VQNLEFYSKILEKCKEALLVDNYKGMQRIDLVRIYNTILNRIQKCDIINAGNINKFLKTQEEFVNSDSDDKSNS
jgi:hypothetical protein